MPHSVFMPPLLSSPPSSANDYGIVHHRAHRHLHIPALIHLENAGDMSINRCLPDGGLEAQKRPDAQGVLLFAKLCRMTGVYDKGAYRVSRLGGLVRFPRG